MILTCPECATRYFVPDDKVGPDGRTVKCASCGARWTAHAEPALELSADEEQGAMARDLFEPPKAAEPEPELSDLPGEELPKAFRQKAENTRKVREAAAVGVVWAGMAAGLALMVVLSVVFRNNVVAIWPKAASVYAMSPFKVNPSGLAIEQVHAVPALQGGHAALSITGVIRNIEDHAITAPALKVSLLTKTGRRVAGKVGVAQDPVIPSGEVRHFAIVILDPPSNGDVLEVTFVDDPAIEKAVRSAVHLPMPATAPEAEVGHAPDLRGAAQPAGPVPTEAPPLEARSLPADDPHALPDAPHHD